MNERDIFAAALDMPDPGERAAYLDRACAGNAELRRHVEGLLAAQGDLGSFLARPALAPRPTEQYDSAPETPGSAIGPYKLLQQIGEGGMGTVFMAEQTHPVRRKVALKVIKAGMDSRQVVARFEAERQALAIMDHPNIARVFDGGTTPSGRPYFVMELVKGAPVTEFCDQNHLTPRQRLELFVSVCQAVQHAHHKGIVHRDLKPSNILVTVHDTTPVVKVIDFGVAKALGQELTDKTLFTGFAQMIGTPLYVSPEQAGQSGLDVDTRSDIYSLGVLLYELLTGTTPFSKERFKTATFDEIRRIIREEEPPRPSTRLSDSGEALAAISARRHTEPTKLTRLVRGELDWIVLKALEKDRSRRYETANGFAGDVQRYLNDETVQACPPSAGYRFRKFARRNKAAVITTSAVLLAVLLAVGSLAAGTVLIWRESRAKEEALGEKDGALKEAKENLARAKAQAGRAEGNFQQTLAAVDEWLKVAPRGESSRRTEELNQIPEVRELRRSTLENARTFFEDFVRAKAADPDTRLERAWAYQRLAAVDAWLHAIELAEEQAPGGADAHHLARQEQRVAEAFAKVEGAYRQANGLLEQLVADSPDNEPRFRAELAASHGARAELLHRYRLADAEAAYRQAVAAWERLAADFRGSPDFRRRLGRAYFQWAKFPNAPLSKSRNEAGDRAIATLEALADEFPKNPDYATDLAEYYAALQTLLHSERRWGDAETVIRKQMAVWEKMADAAPGTRLYRQQLAWSHMSLGYVLEQAGRLPEAVALQRGALKVYEQLWADFRNASSIRVSSLGRDDSERCIGLGEALTRSGKTKEAGDAFCLALAFFEKEAPGLERWTRNPQFWKVCDDIDRHLGENLKKTGRRQEAALTYSLLMDLLEKPAATAQRRDATAGRMFVIMAFRLAGLFTEGGQFEEAEKVNRRGLAAAEKLVADFPRDPGFMYMRSGMFIGHETLLAISHHNLGVCLLRQGRAEESRQAWARAVAVLEEPAPPGAGDLQRRSRLRELYERQGFHLEAVGRPIEAAEAYYRADLTGGIDVGSSHYKAVIRLRPDFAEAHNALGELRVAMGSWDRAVPCFREAIRLKPDYAEAHSNLGSVLAAKKQWDGAVASFTEALRHKPDFPQAHYGLGQALEQKGQPDKALVAYKEAVRCYERAADLPADPVRRADLVSASSSLARAVLKLGGWARAAGKSEEVDRLLQQAVGLFSKLAADLPNDPDRGRELTSASLELSRLARANGKATEADRLWRDAADLVEKLSGREEPGSAHFQGFAVLSLEVSRAAPAAEGDRSWRRTIRMYEQRAPESQELASAHLEWGHALELARRFPEAETHYRLTLALCEKLEKTYPKYAAAEAWTTLAWTTFNARAMLGGALLAQKKYTEAEPLLVQGYEGMKQREGNIPAADKVRLTEALERLVQLHEVCGKPDEAARWRAELAARKAPPREEKKPPPKK
jgi:serine/threonine protein kinase/tetratricopeptide (TPR) repeat protein